MKKYFIPFAIAFATIASLYLQSCVIENKVIKASENAITITPAINDNFTGVSTSNSVSVVVETGKDYSVSVSGPENVVNIIETTVSGGTLNIGFSQDVNIDYGKMRPAIVTVCMPAVKSLSASGQSEIDVKSTINNDVTVSASGQATIRLKDITATNNVSLTTSGQSEISAGTIESTNTICMSSGQATIKLSAINSKSVVLTTSGQSDIAVTTLNASTISADASGQSEITVKKSTGSVKSHTSGQASVSIK